MRTHPITYETTIEDTTHWYVIHANPKQEWRAESNLNAWGMETFLPRIRDCRFNAFTGAPSYLIKPLFPGYLFARFALNSMLHKVRFTRGVRRVVCVGDDPAPVDDSVIDAIVARIDGSGFVKIGAGLESGAKVTIQVGPFKGFTGIFERETSADARIKILLDCVCFQARVEVERMHVKALA